MKREPNSEQLQTAESGNLSRRDFLKKTAILLGFLATSEAVRFTSEAFAESAEDVYGRGIAEIREEVFRNPKEQVHVFKKKPNGSGEWFKLEGGETTFARIDVNELKRLSADSESIELFHTHPLLYGHDYIRNKDGALTLKPNAAPPHFGDVVMGIRIQDKVKTSRVRFKVADAFGVWEWSVNQDHPYAKKLIEIVRGGEKAGEIFGEREDVRRYLSSYSSSKTDPRILILEMLKSHLITEESKKELEKIEKMIEATTDPLIKDLINKENSMGRVGGPEKYADLMAAYRKIGVEITLKAYQNQERKVE